MHLTRAIDATAKELAQDSRAQNLKELIGNIEHLLSVTDPSLKATLKMNPTLFEDTLAQVLGVGFARFMRLENPDRHLFEFLQNTPQALKELLSPGIFTQQSAKTLKDASAYDFAKLLLQSGQNTQELSKAAGLLEPLEARAKAFSSAAATKEAQNPKSLREQLKAAGKSVKETRALLEQNKEQGKENLAGLLAYKSQNAHEIMKKGEEAGLNGAQTLTALYMFDMLKAKEVQARILFKRAGVYDLHLKPEIQEALGTRQIHLTPQSFSKLELTQAKEFSPLLKATFEEPNAFVKQADGALVFVKDFGTMKLKALLDRHNFLDFYPVRTFNKVPHDQEVVFSNLPDLPPTPKLEGDKQAPHAKAPRSAEEGDIVQKWQEAFNVKENEPFIPKFSQEVQEALKPILQGQEIKLTKGSLEKLVKRNREEFLPLIRPTLEGPDAVVKQADGALIFVKDFQGKKFFTSVARSGDDSDSWIIRSNAPKTLNNLQNKIKEGGEVLYSGLPELPIIAKPELPAKALNSEASSTNSTTPPLKKQEKGAKAKHAEYTQMIEDATKEGIINEHNYKTLYGMLEKSPDQVPGYIATIRQNIANEAQALRNHQAFGGGSLYTPEFSPQVKKALEGMMDDSTIDGLYLDLDHSSKISYRLSEDSPFISNDKVGTLEKEAPMVKKTLEDPHYVLHPNEKVSPIVFIREEGEGFFVVSMSPYRLGQWGLGRVNLEELEAFRKINKLTKALQGFSLPPKPKIIRKATKPRSDNPQI
ncbi:PBECR2 nuclease fold domain-containing protein [Helicobacter heilmannii]|uniref:PBECR2 nuclease fold domain-containing protein n=1 Tax=Helicobacter heilmannii TaxID=35817 RepID=UPI0039C8DC9E